MGNRCYLYLRGSGDDAPVNSVAEAKNHVPAIWHVLLAQGAAGRPISYQRIVTSDEVADIDAPASEALERWRRAAAALLQHPEAAGVPGLQRYLDATTAFLQQQVDEVGAGAHFSADLSEIYLLDGHDDEDSQREWQQNFNESWESVLAAERGEGAHRLEDWLGFPSRHRPFTDWDNWLWSFGFGGLDHEYFSRSTDAPRDVAFADFVPTPSNDDLWEWTGWFAMPSEGGVVLHRNFSELDDADAQRLRAVPQAPGVWDECKPVRGHAAAWVRQGALWGLMHLDDAPALVLAPTVDDMGEFADDLVLASQHGLWGVLHLQGQWQLPPQYEGLGELSEGRRVFVQGGAVGFLDAGGREVIPARYAEAEDMSRGMACVAMEVGKNAAGEALWHWGLIDRDGKVLQDCTWDALHDQHTGWQAVQGDKMAWLSVRGELLLPPQWDEVLPMDSEALLRVRQGDLWGLWAASVPTEASHAQARPLLSCSHAHIDLLAWRHDRMSPLNWNKGYSSEQDPKLGAALACAEPPAGAAGNLLFLVQSPEELLGVVDDTAAVRVPVQYSELEPRGDVPGAPRWMDAERAGVQGKLLIDLDRGAEVLGGRAEDQGEGYDRFWPVPLTAPAQWWLSTRGQAEDRPLVRVWNLDGTPAVAGDWAWLQSPMDLKASMWALGVTADLHRAWVKGQPVRAAPAPRADGAAQRDQWICPGHPAVDHEAHLAQAWMEGDADAASTLAQDFRDGNGVPVDAAAARLWAARACGDAAAGARPVPQPSAESMRLYSLMLMDGVGGDADLPAARRWAERAVEQAGGADDSKLPPNLANLLGCLLLLSDAGRTDPARAWALFSHAAACNDATGYFNQGVSLRDGAGVERDMRRAIQAFAAADAAGYSTAAVDVALCMQRLAATPGEVKGEQELQKFCQRIVYHCDKGLAALEVDDDRRRRLWAVKGWAQLRQLPPRWKDAARLLRKAAEAGDSLAMRTLADEVHGNAASPHHDEQKAAHWRERLANADVDEADEPSPAGNWPWWVKAIAYPILLPFAIVALLWSAVRKKK